MNAADAAQATIRVDAGAMAGRTAAQLDLHRLRRDQLHLHPRGRGAAGQVRRHAGASRTTCARTTCCAPATATASTSGARPTPIWRTSTATRSTTGPFVDLIFDTILQHRCKPFVELGFMPQDLVDPAHYDIAKDNGRMQSYRTSGWACPPKDYQKWYDLVYHLVRHCLERYGVEEVTDLVLGAVERAGHLLLARHHRGVQQALRLHRGGGEGGLPGGARRRARHHQPGLSAAPRPSIWTSFSTTAPSGANACTGGKGAPLDFISFHVKGGGYRADPKHRKRDPPSVKQIVDDMRRRLRDHQQVPGLQGPGVRALRDRPGRLGCGRGVGQRQPQLPQH